MNSITYYKYLCLSRIYYNPDLPNYLLQGYKIVLGIFCLYSCIINNWLYLPEYLDIFSKNYIGELSIESNQVNMFPGSGNSSGSPYGYFPSFSGSDFGGNPFGQGPSGNGGSGPPVGNESSTDKDEDFNKSKGKKRAYIAPEATGNDKDETSNERPKRKRGSWLTRSSPAGPQFSYFDTVRNMHIWPEFSHIRDPIYYNDNTIREYNEHGLKYEYHVSGENPFCRISSFDGTKIEIYDASTVMKYIEYHNEEVRLVKRLRR